MNVATGTCSILFEFVLIAIESHLNNFGLCFIEIQSVCGQAAKWSCLCVLFFPPPLFFFFQIKNRTEKKICQLIWHNYSGDSFFFLYKNACGFCLTTF